MTTPKPGPWVVRLPPWLAAIVGQVPHGERGRRLEQHCARRATKEEACKAGLRWLDAAFEAYLSWAKSARSSLIAREPAAPAPHAETMARVPLGRLSPEVKAELARRAAWAGVRTEDYACGVILSAE